MFILVCYVINVIIDNIDFLERVCEMWFIKMDFYEIVYILNCIGVVDGMFILIKGMIGFEEFVYVCRKNFYVLNI